MQKIELKTLGISYSQAQSNTYALIMQEKGGRRRLPIVIGHSEAQSIALEIEKMKPARPLTHDLFKTFSDSFNITLTEVIINKFQDGIFFALIVCTDGVETHQIDSRTSDAVALAIRFGCPIYTYEPVLADAGVEYEGDEPAVKESEGDAETSGNEFGSMNDEELQEELTKAVENEDYERASLIRDEINKRK
jgi:hypothetical protein